MPGWFQSQRAYAKQSVAESGTGQLVSVSYANHSRLTYDVADVITLRRIAALLIRSFLCNEEMAVRSGLGIAVPLSIVGESNSANQSK